MKATVENAKLLAILLAVIQKENSKAKDSLYEQLYAALQEDIDSQSGVKLLQIEGIEDPVPIQVFRGDKGDVGPKGKRGLIGEQGERGEQGIQGVQGTQGDPGRIGPQGLQGDKGDQGEKGDKGDAGRDGQDFDSSQLEKKFTELYDNFVRQISAQVTRMAYARGGMDMSGGGGEVRLEFLDDVNRNSAKQDGHFLKWDSASGKWIGDAANNYTTNSYTQSVGISSATFTEANNTITFLRPDASELKLQINTSGGGSGNGDVSNAYLTSTYVANTEFQRVLANTNAYIASVVLSGNTTTISNANGSTGTSLIANNINSNVSLKRIKAGRNIEIEEVDGDIILTAIPQIDYGFISNDYGSISNPSTDGSVDYGTL